MNIEQLVKDYPNDMELGSKVRELYFEGRSGIDELNEKMKDAKIFESPDGGRTVYVRGWGEQPSTRKKVTNQLNIFNETN
tara:strand:- start:2333 stop:2572 length:240 start_codon:yes stop_codon:yes gene_type:complete